MAKLPEARIIDLEDDNCEKAPSTLCIAYLVNQGLIVKVVFNSKTNKGNT